MAKDKSKAKEKPAEGKDAPEGAAKKKKLIIIIGGVVLLAVIGGGAFMFLGKKGSDPAKPEQAETAPPQGEAKPDKKDEKKEDKKEDKKEEGKDGKKEEGKDGKKEEGKDGKKEEGKDKDGKKDPAFEFGQTHKLKPFHLNLGNPLENRYIQLEVALEYKGGDSQKAELEARTPQIRDAVVSVVSRKTREFLLGPDGKDQLRLEMLNQINQFVDRKIETVYITDMLIE